MENSKIRKGEVRTKGGETYVIALEEPDRYNMLPVMVVIQSSDEPIHYSVWNVIDFEHFEKTYIHSCEFMYKISDLIMPDTTDKDKSIHKIIGFDNNKYILIELESGVQWVALKDEIEDNYSIIS